MELKQSAPVDEIKASVQSQSPEDDQIVQRPKRRKYYEDNSRNNVISVNKDFMCLKIVNFGFILL